MRYSPRLVDQELEWLLAGLPAVALEGPKGVGKTATASRFAQTVLRLDRPDQLQLLMANRDGIATLPRPVLIDEWQLDPPIWDAVRRSVDDDSSPGQYILAGSASPNSARLHSGAGRIVRMRMRPLSLQERNLCTPTVSLGKLLAETEQVVGGHTSVSLSDYANEITRSGFPGIRRQPVEYSAATLDGYLDSVIERDFREVGYVVRRPAALRAWLGAYAAASSTTTSYESIARAASPGETSLPAKSTTQDYREVLSKLWLLDPVPGWIPSRNRLNRMGQMPKHQLADPALAARLMGVTAASLLDIADQAPALLRDGPLLGALFESLVTLSIRVYSQRHRASVHHLRTYRGEHEIDLIVERSDGRVIACEVKLSAEVDDRDVRHLLWLQNQLGDDLIDSVVITTGGAAYRRSDGIAVVPLALLGV